MTPQELMDLPYAGDAEKQLRKDGKWLLDPKEYLWSIKEEGCSKSANIHIDAALEILEATQ